jgi:hypothetical protein
VSPLEEEIYHLFYHDCPSTPLSRLSPMPTLGLVPSVRHLFPAPLLPSSCPPHATSTFGHCSTPLLLHSPCSLVHAPHHPCSGVSYRKCLVTVTFSVMTALAHCSFLSSPHPCYILATAFSLFLAACCVSLGCLCYISAC